MIWTHQGKPIPLEDYHGVPRGWSAPEVVLEHSRLDPIHELTIPIATEPGAPSWLPDRAGWLQYRAALYEVANGVRAGDPACVELAVRFIELRHIGSYSGFIREKLARRLCHVAISPVQKKRLHDHFLALALAGEHTQEFHIYSKLWRQMLGDDERSELISRVRSERGERAAAWLAGKL